MTEAIVTIGLGKNKTEHRIGGPGSKIEIGSLRLRIVHEEGNNGAILIQTPGFKIGEPHIDKVAQGKSLGFNYVLDRRKVLVKVGHR